MCHNRKGVIQLNACPNLNKFSESSVSSNCCCVFQLRACVPTIASLKGGYGPNLPWVRDSRLIKGDNDKNDRFILSVSEYYGPSKRHQRWKSGTNSCFVERRLSQRDVSERVQISKSVVGRITLSLSSNVSYGSNKMSKWQRRIFFFWFCAK